MRFWHLFGIAAVLANHQPRIEDEQSSGLRDNSEDSLPVPTPSPLTLSDLLHPRFSRNAGDDNLKTTVSNLKMVARLTNGVYLLQELIAGRIPSDVLISELLHFGSVTPTQISAINASQIDGAVASLKTLTGSLTPDGKAARAEDSFDSLKAVRDSIDGIGNISDWKGRKHFEDEMKRLSNFGSEMRLLNKLQIETSIWVDTLADFNDQGSKATSAQFVKLKDALVMIKNAHENSEPFKPTFTFNGFSTAMDGISSVTKATAGVNLYKSNSAAIQLLDDEADAFTSFMQSATVKMSNLYDRVADLEAIVTLLKTRIGNVYRIPRKHTFGLANGPSDFSSIPRDMNDPWIRRVVRVDSLKEAFGSLKELIGLIKSMDGVLGRRKDDVAASVRLQSYFAMVKEISADVAKGTPGIKGSTSCQRPSPDTITHAPFTDFNTTVLSIDEKLSKFETGIEELSKLLSKSGIVTKLDEVIKLCDDASKSSDLDQYKQTFLANQHVKDLHGYITKIKDQTISVIDLKPEAAASTVLKTIGALDEYLKKMNHYAGYFKCLQENPDLKSVFGAIDGIQKIRGWKDDNVFAGASVNGMRVVKMVAETAPDLALLKTSITALKGRNVPEFEGLEDLENASIHSQTIGLAVQGISSMSMALEHQTDLIIEDSDLDVVKNNKRMAETGDVANLDSLIKMAPSIALMNTTLNTFNGSVSPFVNSPSFASQSGIFESAKSVTGVSGNFSKMSESVGNLKKKLPQRPEADQLDNVEKALTAMDSMDLDFAKYQKSFNASRTSLAAMDAFLLSYVRKQTPITNAPSPVQSQRRGNYTYPVQEITIQPEESSLKNTLILVAIIVAAVLLLAPFITPLIWFLAFRKSFKKRFFCFWRIKNKFKLSKMIIEKYVKTLDSFRYKERSDNPGQPPEDSDCAVYLAFNLEHETATYIFQDEYKKQVDDVGDQKKFNPEEYTPEVTIRKRFAIVLKGYGKRFENNQIAAAKLELPTKRLMILTQCPQLESTNKLETARKFWWMVGQTKSKTVVMLCPTPEDGKAATYDICFPQEKGKKMRVRDLTLECLELKTEEDLETRVIKAQFLGEKAVTVTHYWKKKWLWARDEEANTMITILSAVLDSKAPSVVFCELGIMSLTLAHMAYACADIRHNNKVDLVGAYVQCSMRGIIFLKIKDDKGYYAYAASMILKYFWYPGVDSPGDTTREDEIFSLNYYDFKSGFARIMESKREVEGRVKKEVDPPSVLDSLAKSLR